MVVKNPWQVWNRRFAASREQQTQLQYEPWLERWLAQVDVSQDVPLLDLGCGRGADTRYLVERGFAVVAADFSHEGLRMVREGGGPASLVEMDLRDGLPFGTKTFQVIIANLSLHYFRWKHTQHLAAMIRACLKADGLLFARLNSTHDANFGATSGEVIERHYRLVNRELKRYFDRDDVEALFQHEWQLRSLEEQVVHCYHTPKVLWEVIVQKA